MVTNDEFLWCIKADLYRWNVYIYILTLLVRIQKKKFQIGSNEQYGPYARFGNEPPVFLSQTIEMWCQEQVETEKG